MTIILMFGPPGSGKGTQAALICKKKGMEHISTGEILRQEAESKSPFGIKLHNLLMLGSFVSDRLVNKIIKKKISNGNSRGFLLDGFPRDVNQAKNLFSIISEGDKKNMKVVNLVLSEKEIVRRLIKRAKIEKREDDNIETIKKRLKIYHSKTEKVISFLKRKGIKIIKIRADDGAGKIFKEISKKI